MIILTIRTDKPEAEIGLFNGQKQIAYETWQAHRRLAETLHEQIAKILQLAGKEWNDVGGIVAYQGPGSFTGLRIGLSVANALVYSLNCPIIGATGKDWIAPGINKLLNNKNNKIVMPEYGSPVHITQPNK